MKKLYLGVDGGQSSTTALVADERGAVLGKGQGGPCNHVTGAEAEAKFNRVIGQCVGEACSQAGFTFPDVCFTVACLGFSGGAEDKRALSEALIRSDRFYITHDAEIALAGATGGEPGIIVISGTGSMAFGRNVAGRSARAGGWGYVFGDEGGAFDLVRQALRAALKFEEGWGPETTLASRLKDVTGVSNLNAVLHAFYTPEYPRSRIASLAHLVSEEAERGDRVATEVVQRAGAQLAKLVVGVHGQLFASHEKVPIAAIGGAFTSKTLRTSLDAQLRSQLNCPLSAPRMNPAAGALLQALRLDANLNLPSGPGLTGK